MFIQSINVALVAFVFAQVVEVVFGFVTAEFALGFDDFDQGVFDIACHACGVAADVEVCALLQPVPNFGGAFGDFVLDVDFVFALSAPCKVGAGEEAVFAPFAPFELVEEVVGQALVAEEEPVFAAVAIGGALLHKGAEGGDACACADHDDGGIAVLWQAEVGVGFDKDVDFAAFFEAFAQVAGCCAGVGVVVVVETDDADGEVDFFADFVLCGGDGIETWGLWAEEAV